MTARRIACALLLVAALAAPRIVRACEGERIAKLVNVAVTRCLHRTVTLSFDEGNERKFVIVDDADARRIYETLKVYYEERR